MLVTDFDFELPNSLIAQAPLNPRSAAKLLVVGADGQLQDRKIADLVELLTPQDLLIVNDCKVLPTRLDGHLLRIDGTSAARIEVTLLEDIGNSASDQQPTSQWLALAKPARKAKLGMKIEFGAGFMAEVMEKHEDGSLLLALPYDSALLREKLWQFGRMPLPPYIKRKDQQADQIRQDHADYQTIFARREGAVAAPTAGLHIDEAMRQKLRDKQVGMVAVTLMVGAGTFQPVRVEDTKHHQMHREWGEVSQAAADEINRHCANGGRIVALGTTSLRILEQAARQSPQGADGRPKLQSFAGYTQLFLTPGSDFLLVDGLITNFHLPKSTLFMLVSAFAGLERMQAAYRHAIDRHYRFYSYGDACYLQRPNR